MRKFREWKSRGRELLKGKARDGTEEKVWLIRIDRRIREVIDNMEGKKNKSNDRYGNDNRRRDKELQKKGEKDDEWKVKRNARN